MAKTKLTYAIKKEYLGYTVSTSIGGEPLTIFINADMTQEAMQQLYEIGHPAIYILD